jgi:hypothetical protein
MTQKELQQFIDAVVQASLFSPRVSSAAQQEWRATIERNGGAADLMLAIAEAEKRAA